MTKDEMRIEVKALEETIAQLSRNDGRMNTKVDAICVDMEKKVLELKKQLDPHYIPPDKACYRCGAYTTTGYCSRFCARGENKP